jgi:hypothetical protein
MVGGESKSGLKAETDRIEAEKKFDGVETDRSEAEQEQIEG